MSVQVIILLIFYNLLPCRSDAQDNPEKDRDFKGYVLTDSLEYNAESIDYYFDERQVILNNKANIRYLGRVLKSNTITYYQDYQYIEAVGEQDSTGTPRDTPEFNDEGGEPLNGLEIKYNLKSRQGIVLDAKTKYETGFMTAEKIKRTADDTLFISNGWYTTCDDENPHYYFSGIQMKYILKDKLIIKPIIAYVQDIPVFWFPFYVFPISQGRQSGFLSPRYGSSRQDGRYLSNIGYYFAPSEYLDFRISTTVRERNGWLANNWFNYNKRYSMSGSLYGSYENESRENTRQWRISGSHQHTISPTLSMSGRLDMQSSEFSKRNSPNYFQSMNRNMNSSLRISKKWKQSGNSLITYVSHTKNLDSESRTTVAPSLSFTKPKKLLFGAEKAKGKQRKYTQKSSETDQTALPGWYESIYYSLRADFKTTERDNYTLNSATNNYDIHTFSSMSDMGFRTSLTSSNKLLGWLTANPSLNLDERFTALNDSVSHKRKDNISAGLSLNTKIYGTFAPKIGKLVGLRHVITPSITFRYGKRREYEGTGSEVFYRFDKNDAQKGKISTMRISLRNLFQAKTVDGDEENKIDLFALDFATGIDFEKDELPISPLSTTLDIKPLQTVKIRMSATHSFYHDDKEFYLFSPYLNNMSITTNVGLSGRRTGQMATSSRVNANRNLGRDIFDTDIDETDEGPDISGSAPSIPIRLSFTHYYRLSKSKRKVSGGYSYRKTHTIKPNVSFSPSRHFSVQYNLYYDIEEKTLTYHRVTIKRDLHCWEANLSWVPSGVREGFYLLVNIKDLPDVKIEKRRGVSRFSG